MGLENFGPNGFLPCGVLLFSFCPLPHQICCLSFGISTVRLKEFSRPWSRHPQGSVSAGLQSALRHLSARLVSSSVDCVCRLRCWGRDGRSPAGISTAVQWRLAVLEDCCTEADTLISHSLDEVGLVDSWLLSIPWPILSYLSRGLADRWGTTVDTTSFRLSSRFPRPSNLQTVPRGRIYSDKCTCCHTERGC